MELMLEILWARKALAASFESSLEVVGMLMRIVRMMLRSSVLLVHASPSTGALREITTRRRRRWKVECRKSKRSFSSYIVSIRLFIVR